VARAVHLGGVAGAEQGMITVSYQQCPVADPSGTNPAPIGGGGIKRVLTSHKR
jgi:hypothetical protein